MLVFAIICNLLIALINLTVAFRLWKLRRLLAKVSEILDLLERSAYYLLYFAPIVITPGQKNARNLKQKYRQLQYQLKLVRQILRFLNLLKKVWPGNERRKYLQSIRKLASEELVFSWPEYPIDRRSPEKNP
ncbi:MAG: hypothetical protein ACFBSE_11315 [Prochloraceae cyanobacterium]